MKVYSIILTLCIIFTIDLHPDKISASPISSVIVITIDTLRADHMSCYGYGVETTPHIDRLAKMGTRFRWAFSTSPQTAPSHVSIFTGKYPSFHSIGTENIQHRLNPKEITLAALCQARGIRTAAVVSNIVLDKSLGLDQGFDSYDDQYQQRELNRDLPEQHAKYAVDKAVTLLKQLKNDRFFIWLHLQDPHGPYHAPAQVLPKNTASSQDNQQKLPFSNVEFGYRSIPFYQQIGQEQRVSEYIWQYDNEIAYMDRELNRLFQYMETHRLLESTMVIITSDHGEAFGEDDFYFAHGHSVAIDQTRIPLILIGPGITENHVITNAAVSNIDIYATVLDMMGLHGISRVQSRSLRHFLTGKRPGGNAAIFVESESQRGGILGNAFLRQDRSFLDPGNRILPKDRPGNPWRNGKIFLQMPSQFKILFPGTRIKQRKLNKVLKRFRYRCYKKSRRIRRIDKLSAKGKKDSKRLKKLKTLGYID